MKTNIILAAALLLGISTASAATVFSNLGQSQDSTRSLTATSQRIASDFLTDASAWTITTTTLSMDNLDNVSHTFTASIFTDNSGVPGTLVGSFDPFTIPANSPTLANYTGNSAGIDLSANTIYWEVLKQNQFANAAQTDWASTNSQATDAGSVFSTISATPTKFSNNSGASYSNFGGGGSANFQFSLGGIGAPEPSRALLMLGGLGSLLMRRRR